MRSIGALVLFVGLSLAAGGIGSFSTMDAIPTWYATLTKPSFNPPNWVFGPVWTTLYVLMGIAAWRVSRSTREGKHKVLTLFIAHLFVNCFWSIAFFGMQNPELALGTIAVLWLLILTLITSFWKYSKLASVLLLPYLAWVSFASVLNYHIVILN